MAMPLACDLRFLLEIQHGQPQDGRQVPVMAKASMTLRSGELKHKTFQREIHVYIRNNKVSIPKSHGPF
jgi:hypothetical protein